MDNNVRIMELKDEYKKAHQTVSIKSKQLALALVYINLCVRWECDTL